MEPNYKFGFRLETTWQFWLGIGINTFGEKGVLLGLGFFELNIGKVYA